MKKLKPFGHETGRVYWRHSWRNCATLYLGGNGRRFALAYPFRRESYNYRQMFEALLKMTRAPTMKMTDNHLWYVAPGQTYGSVVATRKANTLRVWANVTAGKHDWQASQWRGICAYAAKNNLRVYCDPRDAESKGHNYNY